MDSSDKVIFVWTCIHHLFSVFFNLAAFVALICRWKKIGKGHDVRWPFSIWVMVTTLNLLGLVLVELPRLYSLWTKTSFIFGVRLCQYLWISSPILEVFQIHFSLTAIFCIWIDQKRLAEFSASSTGKQILSVLVCIFSLGLVGLGRVYHPQNGKSGTLQTFVYFICPKENLLTIWTFCFRWCLGLILPVMSLFSLALHLRLKWWLKCSSVLKLHIKFCAAMTFMNLLLQIPAFIADISSLREEFSSHLFAVVLPKIVFSAFPIGILTIMKPNQEEVMLSEEDLKLLPINLQKSPTTAV